MKVPLNSEEVVDWEQIANNAFMLTQQVLIDHLDDELAGKSAVDIVLLHVQRLDGVKLALLNEMKGYGPTKV